MTFVHHKSKAESKVLENNVSKISDEIGAPALVEKAVDGDFDAFGKLYDVYLDHIYRYVYYHIKNRVVAGDLTEEIFIKAWHAIGKYKQSGQPFFVWLFHIAHNHVVDYYRTSRQDTGLEELVQPDLLKTISHLAPQQMQVIVLKFIEGLEDSEIAQIMRKSQGAIRPHLHRQLEQLVYTAMSIAAIPKVSPSAEFRQVSHHRLMGRLHEQPIPSRVAPPRLLVAPYDKLTTTCKTALCGIIGARKVVLPVTLALLLALGGSFAVLGVPSFFSSAPALGSQCTVTTLRGTVVAQSPNSNVWKEAENGITLEVGTRVKTTPNSHALVTFFDGSTVKLEPNTDITIQQVEGMEGQSRKVVLKQWLGKTWSHVVQVVDPGSHYEIQTPSASAIVRGTLFMTEVDEGGSTTVQTIEGLVATGAQNEEVNIPAGYKTTVEFGAAPSQPVPIEFAGQGPGGEEPPGQSDGGPPGQSEGGPPGQGPGGEGPPGQSDGGPPGQSDGGPPGQGPGGEGPPGQSDGGPPGQSDGGPPGQSDGGPPGQSGEAPGQSG